MSINEDKEKKNEFLPATGSPTTTLLQLRTGQPIGIDRSLSVHLGKKRVTYLPPT